MSSLQLRRSIAGSDSPRASTQARVPGSPVTSRGEAVLQARPPRLWWQDGSMAAAPPGPEHFEHLRRLLVLERSAEERQLAGERARLSQGERESLGLSAGDLE